MAQKKQTPENIWIDRILNALDNLEYGSVHIVVHDSKIMQIERTEKMRYSLERVNPAENRSSRTENTRNK